MSDSSAARYKRWCEAHPGAAAAKWRRWSKRHPVSVKNFYKKWQNAAPSTKLHRSRWDEVDKAKALENRPLREIAKEIGRTVMATHLMRSRLKKLENE